MSWLSDAAVIARVEADYEQRGVRLYPYKLNHLVDVYGVFRKWAADGRRGEGHAAWSQLGAQLYDDVTDHETVQRKRQSLRNWTRELQRLGLLQVREHKNQRGQSDGIWWALASDPVSARSSAGSSVGTSCYTRREETRQEARERRIRPHCRRSGRQGVGRYVKSDGRRARPPASLNGSESLAPLSPSPPTGAKGVQQDVTRAALAVNTAGSNLDASPAVQGPNVGNRSAAPVTSTAATRTRSAAPDRAAELQQALAAFERRFGRPSLPLKPDTWQLWLQATRRGDRYGGWTRSQPGLALQFVVDRIESWTGKPASRGAAGRDLQHGRPAEPASLAYFVALLDDASKHWRHAWRHEHGLCRRPQLCRANAWMYPAQDDRLRNRAKWEAYDREVEQVRRVLNDAGYAAAGSAPA